MDTRRALAGCAAAAATALALCACTATAGRGQAPVRWGPCPPPTAGTPAATRPSGTEATCTTLRVPSDHDDPRGDTLSVQVVRLHQRAAGSPASREPLLVVAGGPGQSGVDYAPVAASLVPPALLARFDLIGFDPRGVGRSGQIRCHHADQGRMPLPDLATETGFAAASTRARREVQECVTTLGDRAPVFSTTATARDIDVLRSALGQERLTLVGWSYGAKLVGEYARLFPQRVRAAVLDAPTDPTSTWEQTVEHQVAGFEGAFTEFARWCRGQPVCRPLGDVTQSVRRLAQRADIAPISSGRPGDDEPSTGWDVMMGVVSAMYDRATWPDLAAGIREAREGDSGTLRELGEAFFSRREVLDANFVINCNDTDARPTEAEVRASAARLRDRYPVFGQWGAWGLFGCGYWDVARHPLRPPSAATATRLLVIGSVGDPATPYAGAQAMARALGNAALLTWEGDAHAAFGRSACIGDHVVAYLRDLVLPRDGTRCPP